jgi:glycosyltransferase involved in cell wall biosynthesis
MGVLVSFIVPVYNEADSIGKTVAELRRVGEKSARSFEIVVVNDGSSDGTEEALKKIKDIRSLRHAANLGYGAALKTGIKNAQGEWIAIIDADQTYPAEQFEAMFKEMENFDMVVGARTGKKVHVPLMRRPAKWLLQRLSNALTNQKIPDLNSGMRVFKKEIAQRFLKIIPEGFSFTTTITIAALCNGYAVKYIPINYFKRKGKSSISPIKDFLGFFQLIIRLAVYFKPLNVFLPMCLVFFLVGAAKMAIDAIRLAHFGIGGVAMVLMSFQILFLGLLADLINKRTDL